MREGVVVVSDTSPLRALAHLGLVGALGELFADVVIPPAVFAEVSAGRPKLPALDLTPFPFIRVVPVSNLAGAARFVAGLDPGESEAIALALELRATRLLIDERKGRIMAIAAGLAPMGVLGLLVQFKQIGLIPSVRPAVERLIAEIDFWVSPQVLGQALKSAGE